jgi:hypothetical protein
MALHKNGFFDWFLIIKKLFDIIYSFILIYSIFVWV